MAITNKIEENEGDLQLLKTCAIPNVLPEVGAQIILNSKYKDNRIEDNKCAERKLGSSSSCSSSELSISSQDENQIQDEDINTSSVIELLVQKSSCTSVRRLMDRSPLSNNQIQYMRLSLHSFQGQPTTLTMNVDFRLTTTPKKEFNQLVFSLSNRGRDFKRTIEDKFEDWETDTSYGNCFDFYNQLKNEGITCWIGKGRERRKFKAGVAGKPPLTDFTCMTIYYSDEGVIGGRIYIEDVMFDFEIDEAATHKNFAGHTTVVKQGDAVSSRISVWK